MTFATITTSCLELVFVVIFVAKVVCTLAKKAPLVDSNGLLDFHVINKILQMLYIHSFSVAA